MSVQNPSLISKTLVVSTQVADYIPIMAAVSNIAQAIFKVILQLSKISAKSPYFHMISQKTYSELFLKTLPLVGQFYALKEAFLSNQYIHVPPSCFQDIAIIRIRQGLTSLRSLPIYYTSNYDFIKKAAQAGCDVSESHFFQTDLQLFKICINHHPKTYLNQKNTRLFQDQSVLAEAYKKPQLLRYVSQKIKTTHTLDHILASLSGDELYSAIANFDVSAIPADKLLTALARSYKILNLIPKRNQTLAQVEQAIQNNGLAIQYAAFRFQDDLRLITLALEQNPLALEFVNINKVSDALFEKCVEKNPLAWAFGSLKQQKNIELRLKIILKNPKADLKLFRMHGGNRENMIVDLASLLLRENPYGIFSIPYPFCLNGDVLKVLLSSIPAQDQEAVFKQIEKALPTTLISRLQTSHPVIFSKLSSAVKALITDTKNLTGACTTLELEKDDASVFGFKANSKFRKINKAFLTAQKVIHETGKWNPPQSKSWEDAYSIMRKHASYMELPSINDKYNAFLYERPFFASAQGGTQDLSEYFKQAKVYLCQIAGYIQANPDDHGVIRQLIEATQVCAGGLMSQLAQIVENHCVYSGNPPIQYRVAKLSQRLAARAIQHCALKSYHSTDVHVINRLAKEFNDFYLDKAVHDAFQAYGFDAENNRTFFDQYNAQTLLQEVVDESRHSPSFKQSIKEFVEANSALFAEDQFAEKKAEAHQKYTSIILELQSCKDRFIEYTTLIQVLPQDLKDILQTNIIATGRIEMRRQLLTRELKMYFKRKTQEALVSSSEAAKIASLKVLRFSDSQIATLKDSTDFESDFAELIHDNDAFKLILTYFDRFRGPLHPFFTNASSLAQDFKTRKEDLLEKVRSGTLLTSSVPQLLKDHWEESYKKECGVLFLQEAYDTDGHFTQEAIAHVLDKANIFVDPFKT